MVLRPCPPNVPLSRAPSSLSAGLRLILHMEADGEGGPQHLSVTAERWRGEVALTATGRARYCTGALAAVNLVSSQRKHHLVCRRGALGGTLLVSEQRNVFAP